MWRNDRNSLAEIAPSLWSASDDGAPLATMRNRRLRGSTSPCLSLRPADPSPRLRSMSRRRTTSNISRPSVCVSEMARESQKLR